MNPEERRKGRITPRTYDRLQEQLEGLFASLGPGARLPSEPALARELGVSRATLREAMRSFEGQGLIRRHQGVGTFVVGQPPVFESGLEVLESIESLAHRIGLDVSMGEVHIETVGAGQDQAQALKVAENTPLVQISRVIRAGSRPVAYLVDALPEDILTPDDLSQGFTGSVLDFLLNRGALSLTRSVADIRAVAASAELARLLETRRDAALLEFVAWLYTSEERIVDYSLSYFLPGYFRFHVVRRVGKTYR